MNIIKTPILKSNIDNKLWLEIIFAMDHIKYCQSTKTLSKFRPYKASFEEHPNLAYFQILSFIIYILLYKKE